MNGRTPSSASAAGCCRVLPGAARCCPVLPGAAGSAGSAGCCKFCKFCKFCRFCWFCWFSGFCGFCRFCLFCWFCWFYQFYQFYKFYRFYRFYGTQTPIATRPHAHGHAATEDCSVLLGRSKISQSVTGRARPRTGRSILRPQKIERASWASWESWACSVILASFFCGL